MGSCKPVADTVGDQKLRAKTYVESTVIRTRQAAPHRKSFIRRSASSLKQYTAYCDSRSADSRASADFFCLPRNYQERDHEDRHRRLTVAPVIRIAGVAGREPDIVTVRVDAETENRSIRVREVGGDLVDLQDLAVVETGLSQRLDIVCR